MRQCTTILIAFPSYLLGTDAYYTWIGDIDLCALMHQKQVASLIYGSCETEGKKERKISDSSETVGKKEHIC